MAVGIKRFNWVQRPTRWESAQAWRAHRGAMVQRFRDEPSAAGTAFLSAQTNLSTGLASLAAQASIQRAQNEIKAAREQFGATRSQIDKLV